MYSELPACVQADIEGALTEADIMVSMHAETFRQRRARDGHEQATADAAGLIADLTEAELRIWLVAAFGRLADTEDDRHADR